MRADWPLWRTFLIEQRALLRELAELDAAAESVQVPVLLIADPADRVVPVKTSHRLAEMLPDARLSSSRAPGITCRGARRARSRTRSRSSSRRSTAARRGRRDADEYQVPQAS